MIKRLQSLRFVAAGLVLVGHVLMEMHQHDAGLRLPSFIDKAPWGVGVDIFFVISGFIISYASRGRASGAGSVGDFMVHRLIRLWPTYAIFTLLMLAAVLVVPSFLRHASIDAPYVLASLAFVPWPRPGSGGLYPLLGQGWTLNYEMFFYVSFAAVLMAPDRWRAPILAVGAILLVALAQVAPLPPVLEFYGQPIILEFIFGVMLGRLYPSIPHAPLWGGLCVIAAFAFLFGAQIDTQTTWRSLSAGVPAALIVGGVLLMGPWGERNLGRPSLVLLGNASYALYLSHPFVVNALLWLFMKAPGRPSMMLFGILATAFSIVGSIVAYKLIEQPAIKILKSRYEGRRGGKPYNTVKPTVAA
jgi:exopolysaccharide production protein ExoZ